MEDLWRDLVDFLGDLFDEFFTTDGRFELPIHFSLLAYFTFGITGALAALRRGYDVVGVLFLAAITAAGGGLIRDGMLISTGPPSILVDHRPLVAVAVACVLTFFFHRQAGRLNHTIAVIDAIGLGAFAVSGTQRSLEAGLSVPAAILGGTITAVGGGLLRDVLVRDEPLLFKPGQFYALVAIAGSAMYVALVRMTSIPSYHAAWSTIAAVLVVRALAIKFNWRTSALYREPAPPPPPA